MISHEDFRRALGAKLRSSFERVAPSTVAFYRAGDDGVVRNLHGTGVLLQVADAGFLMSAAHVTDIWFRDREHLGITGGTGLGPIRSIEYRRVMASVLPPSGLRTHDMMDMSVVELSESAVRDLKSDGARFLSLAELNPEPLVNHRESFMVVGFPGVLSWVDPTLEATRAVRYYCGVGAYDHRLGELPSFHPMVEIALNYDRTSAMEADGTKRILPTPHGLSGGGVWRIRVDPRNPSHWTPEDVELVAILHTANETADAVYALRATRVWWAIRGIYENHPDMRRAIELELPWLPDALRQTHANQPS